MSKFLRSVPSRMKTWEELGQTVIADLIGSVGRRDEEGVGPTVRDRYLVGVLAPRRRKVEPRVE